MLKITVLVRSMKIGKNRATNDSKPEINERKDGGGCDKIVGQRKKMIV